MDATTISDDDRLMLRLQAGDRSAFDALVERHQGALFGFFLRNTRDRQLAEDLTQETLLRLYEQAWDYLPRGRFRGWLFRVARNLLIDSVRRRSHDALVRAAHSRDGDSDALARLADAVLSPDVQANHRELAAMVDEALAELPEEQRMAFTLHHYVGLTLAEVAEIMEVPLSTCKSRLRLAREKLQDWLKQRGVRSPQSLES